MASTLPRAPVPPACLLGALCLAGLGAALPAQQFPLVPRSMVNVEGGSASSIPFGTNQPVRFQCLYDQEELPWTGPRVINGIAVRADNTDPGTTTFAAKQYIVMHMVMSTTNVKAEASSSTFLDNWGDDRATVIQNGRIVLPAQPPVPGVRAPNIVLAFDQPWVYGASPVRTTWPPPGGLLLEMQIQLQPAGTYRVDNLGNCSGTPTPFGNLGPACLTSRSVPLTVVPDTSMVAGSTYSWTVSGMPANGVFSLALDLSDQGAWFGLPLPVRLFDPANPFGPVPGTPFPYGAPDCWVNVNTGYSAVGGADQAGVGRITVNLPPGRRYVGMSLYAQAVAFDLSANPLLLVTSLGQRSTVCGPLGVMRLYHVGNDQALTGQRALGQGLVFDVR